MRLIENKRYLDMLKKLHEDFPHWEKLNGACVFLSGATGLLGSFLVDAVMLRNEELPAQEQCRLITVGRSRASAERRFGRWMESPALDFIEQDIVVPVSDLPEKPDYWIHAASTSHNYAFATEPINTVLSNVLGTRNILDLVSEQKYGKFLFVSSGEVYGENRGDMEYFKEDYCGYLDCNTLRAGYPEAKRLSEALCQAYIQQNYVDAMIIRLPRCYGPTMQEKDSKAAAQFIQCGVKGTDVVLKSSGEQCFSFAHVADAVCGMLWVLLAGETGQAYNLGDQRSDVTLKALAGIAADHAGTKVIFDLPNAVEKRGYCPARKTMLDAGKLRALGWKARYDVQTGICETIDILRELSKEDAR